MKRTATVMVLLFLFAQVLRAQGLVSLGLGINRYGLAGSVKIHRADADNKKWRYGDLLFELGNIQHPREVALINNTLQSAGIYKFGKVNYAWTLRSYYMARYQLSGRQDKKSVALNAVGGIGIPLAYSWPVYILLYQPQSGPGENFTEVRYDPQQHPQALIGGRAPFTRGFGEGRIHPGLGLNTGLEFSWGNYRSDVKVVTLGVRLEAYNTRIPIMYLSGMNQRLFSMFYLTFAFGFGNQ